MVIVNSMAVHVSKDRNCAMVETTIDKKAGRKGSAITDEAERCVDP
jgi:hypothetical protein